MIMLGEKTVYYVGSSAWEVRWKILKSCTGSKDSKIKLT